MADELSTFDTETFLNQQVDAAFETKYTLLPMDDYKAMVDRLAARRVDSGQIILDVLWKLLDVDTLKEKLGLREAIVKQGVFLDYDKGILEFGTNKNIKLGQIRDALGQNKKGQPWNFNKLLGAGPALVHVIIDGDYNKVTRVS